TYGNTAARAGNHLRAAVGVPHRHSPAHQLPQSGADGGSGRQRPLRRGFGGAADPRPRRSRAVPLVHQRRHRAALRFSARRSQPGVRRRRGADHLLRDGVFAGLHEWRSVENPLFRHAGFFRLVDARLCLRRGPAAVLHFLGVDRTRLLLPDRVLVREAVGRRSGQEGLPDDAGGGRGAVHRNPHHPAGDRRFRHTPSARSRPGARRPRHAGHADRDHAADLPWNRRQERPVSAAYL
ncbi:uncharacterized protein METZ01_LOCUS494914, partial [marine metagenome]